MSIVGGIQLPDLTGFVIQSESVVNATVKAHKKEGAESFSGFKRRVGNEFARECRAD
jgi:hypothetical protein